MNKLTDAFLLICAAILLLPYALFAAVVCFVVLVLGLLLLACRWMMHAHRRWYDTSVERSRHRIEEDARRFNGTVKWGREP